MIRRQRYLQQAMAAVDTVERAGIAAVARGGYDHRATYLSLCRTFPVLVMTDGLCQSVAFIEANLNDKPQPGADEARQAAKQRQPQAYSQLKLDIAKVLEINDADLQAAIQRATIFEYMRYTQTVLDAWVYFKRFAEAKLRTADEAKGSAR